MLTVNQATLIQCGFHEGECIIISAFKRTNGGLPHAFSGARRYFLARKRTLMIFHHQL